MLVFIKKSKVGEQHRKIDIKQGKNGGKPLKLLKKTKKVDILKQLCYSLAKLMALDTPGQVFGQKMNKITISC